MGELSTYVVEGWTLWQISGGQVCVCVCVCVCISVNSCFDKLLLFVFQCEWLTYWTGKKFSSQMDVQNSSMFALYVLQNKHLPIEYAYWYTCTYIHIIMGLFSQNPKIGANILEIAFEVRDFFFCPCLADFHH